MRIFLPLLLLCTACTEETEEKPTTIEDASESSETDTDNAESDAEDTGVDPEDSDSSETDPEDPAIILQEGDWNAATPTIVSDSCELNNFQDVSEFVPEIIEVFNSSETSFNIDDTIVCTIDELSFQCDPQMFTESVLFDSATMTIRNVMSGDIVNGALMDLYFDVTVESCDGVGCWAVESVLDFPCPVELTTSANY